MNDKLTEWFQKYAGSDVSTLVQSADEFDRKTPLYGSKDKLIQARSIERALHVKKAINQINTYDSEKKKDSAAYTVYADNLINEVDSNDVNDTVDAVLMESLKNKLGFANKMEDMSVERRHYLQEQAEIAKERAAYRDNRCYVIKNKMFEYDQVKKQNDAQYRTYEDNCIENEIPSDDEGQTLKGDTDREMYRVLQEKLGVYDDSQESEAMKQLRRQKIENLEQRLNQENKERHKKYAIAKRIEASYRKDDEDLSHIEYPGS